MTVIRGGLLYAETPEGQGSFKNAVIITSKPMPDMLKVTGVEVYVETSMISVLVKYLEENELVAVHKETGMSTKQVSRLRRGLGIPDGRIR